jgi:hypothetical protein
MFCKEKNDPSTLPCKIKLVSEIISIIAIVFSSFIIHVTRTRTKLNVINKLILQILISEIIDGIDILLVIVDDVQGDKTFENYFIRRGVCFSQIFLSLFVCLWTLTSSFLISFRLFDITVKKGAIFRKPIFKKINVLCIAVPMFISFWFWYGQTVYQSKSYDSLDYSRFYIQGRVHLHFRHMHCWYEKNVNYALFAIAILIIGGAVFFSVKGIIVMKGIHTKLTDEIEVGRTSTVNKRKANVEYIINTLWIYPITTGILWLLFFILQICYDNGVKTFATSLIYCIVISVRQLIYALVFLFTQRDIKQKSIQCLTCKGRKKKKSIIIANIDEDGSLKDGKEPLEPNSESINE